MRAFLEWLRWVLVLGAVLGGRVATAQVPASQPFDLASQWAPWTGQVAATCGPGKNCSVATLTVGNARNAPVTGTFSIQLPQPGGRISWCAAGNCNWGTAIYSASLGWDFSSGGGGPSATMEQYFVSVNGYVSGTSGAGTAFASFPACSAGTNGRLLFDSTANRWRMCVNGSGWLPTGNVNQLGDFQTVYFPGIAGLLNLPMTQFDAPSQLFVPGSTSLTAVFSLQLASATTLVAGVGAGNAIFTIYNVTDSAATGATVTVPCASTAGTVTAGNIDSTITPTAIKTFQLRLTTNGCTTLPQVNLQFGWRSTPAGS